MSMPFKIERVMNRNNRQVCVEHFVLFDLFNFEHVTCSNNVWENVNIIGDVLIQAYIILRLHFHIF